MSLSRVGETRDRLARYLAGDDSLDQFKDWLVGTLLEAEQDGDTAAEDVIFDIMLPMAEESSGYITEDDLRRALRPLLHPAPVIAVS